MRRQLSFLALLAVLPAGAVAQQFGIEQLRDSLGRTSSVTELRQREYALAHAAGASDPATMMERGLVLIRLYELTHKNEDGDAARKAFERVIEKDPRSGWAHYGLGLALLAGPGVRVPTPGGVLNGFVLTQSLAELVGRDPRSRAGKQFLRAVDLDPSISRAAIELATLALDSRNKDLLRQTQVVLEKMVAGGSASSDVTAALARVQSALDDVAGAEATIADAAGHGGSATLLARAEALLRQPGKEDAGAMAYFEGAGSMDNDDIRAYFKDVRVIASDREIADWNNGGLESRRAWITRFWDVRAAPAGKTVAERLASHYQRLAEAQNRYRRSGKRGVAPGGALLQQEYNAEQLPFDDRGIIYVRRGEPEHVVRTASMDLRPSESWVYTLPNGRQQLYHFVVLRDGTDYRIVDDILQAIDPTSQEMPYEGIINLLEALAPYDQRYNLLAMRFQTIRNNKWGSSAANIQCVAGGGTNCTGPNSAAAGIVSDGVNSMLQSIAQTRVNIANENREAALIALATDSDRPVFGVSLPFYYDVYTFKGTEGQTDVTAAIAIPGTSLEARRVDNALVYSLQLSLIVIDTIFGDVTRRDTTFHFRSDRALTDGEHLRLHASLVAPASRTTVHRIVVRDLARPGRGQMYGGRTTVPAYDDPGLMISDIVLAEPEGGTWHRGNADLGLVPPRQFVEGQPLTLFYELYNLPRDAPYRTEVTLAPVKGSTGFGKLKKLLGGNDGTVRLQFDGVAATNAAGHVQEIRRVTTGMKSGKYRVQVRVTNLASQQVTSTSKEFMVIDQK